MNAIITASPGRGLISFELITVPPGCLSGAFTVYLLASSLKILPCWPSVRLEFPLVSAVRLSSVSAVLYLAVSTGPAYSLSQALHRL